MEFTIGMIYWQALNEEGKELASGNIPLTVEEVEAWGLITVIKNYDKVTQTYTLAQLLLYNV